MFGRKKESLVPRQDVSENRYEGTIVHVKVAYVCPLCGTRVLYGDAVDILYDEMPSVLGKFVQNQLFAGNPVLHKVPMQLPHKCKNGDAGLAQLSGLVQVAKE